MTKNELLDFIRQSNYISREESDYDSSGNHYECFIYENNGKFYRIEMLNDDYCEKYGDKGCIRGEYEPQEVTKKTRIIEEIYYE